MGCQEIVMMAVVLEQGTPTGGSRRRPAYGWASLTSGERTVAAIVAEGVTNREAAARLFLSPHTIDFHLRQIFRKLGISSRVTLTRLVVQHSLAGSPAQVGR
jgi:DNA-binding CsgD family transcriptional regulator